MITFIADATVTRQYIVLIRINFKELEENGKKIWPMVIGAISNTY